MGNLETVQEIYQAFGTGNVPAILNHLSETVEWDVVYERSLTDVPWTQPIRGKNNVVQFFQNLMENAELKHFDVTKFLDGGDVVVALCDVELAVKKNGKKIQETDEAHVWRFDSAGKVASFKHSADTHQHAQAWKD
jgi:ketosteroid isomerase-like protein